jgi:hypothetical protein
MHESEQPIVIHHPSVSFIATSSVRSAIFVETKTKKSSSPVGGGMFTNHHSSPVFSMDRLS